MYLASLSFALLCCFFLFYLQLGKAGQDPNAIMPLAQDVVQRYGSLAADARQIVAASEQQDVSCR